MTSLQARYAQSGVATGDFVESEKIADRASTAEVGDSIQCRSVFVRRRAAPGLNNNQSRAAVVPVTGTVATEGRFVLLRAAYTVSNHPSCVKDRAEAYSEDAFSVFKR